MKKICNSIRGIRLVGLRGIFLYALWLFRTGEDANILLLRPKAALPILAINWRLGLFVSIGPFFWLHSNVNLHLPSISDRHAIVPRSRFSHATYPSYMKLLFLQSLPASIERIFVTVHLLRFFIKLFSSSFG